jgi:AcrR family transcriptional regulator
MIPSLAAPPILPSPPAGTPTVWASALELRDRTGGVGTTQYGGTVQLTRRRVITTAMDLIEREGIEALSMHRLAAVLGCGVVSLYCYVPSKAALLDGVADAVMSGIELHPARGSAPDAACWPERIRAQATAFREIASKRPRCAMAIVTRRPSSASTLRPVEQALATLSEGGFGHQESVRVIQALIAYVMGSVLRDIEVAPDLDADDGRSYRPRLRPGEFPHLVTLAAEPAASDPDADFEFGLDLLMRSVAAMQPTQANASLRAC